MKFAFIVPLPVPAAVTVSQAESLEAVQEELESTVKFVVPGRYPTFWFGGVTDKVGLVPFWVTVTTTGDIPFTVTVILAILLLLEVFTE